MGEGVEKKRSIVDQLAAPTKEKVSGGGELISYRSCKQRVKAK